MKRADGHAEKKVAPRRGRVRPVRRSPGNVRGREQLVPVVGIGASAGGVEAASELLSCLPADTGMAFVFIQHLDPEHRSFLPDVLARATRMPVAQAANRVRLEPDHVYVIPPNAELSLSGPTLRLAPRPVRPPGQPALPIDSFLRSLAQDRGRSALGVVLSGTASDGTAGLRAIQENDGITFVQDPRTARFAGMPQSAIAAGVADRVLPIPELARELVRLSRHPYVAPHARERGAGEGDEVVRDQICALVRNVVGVDFKEYKPASFERRLGRRMALRELRRLAEYLELLRVSRPEVEALAEDLLVHVTSFFRDPEAFDGLKAQVLPRILEHKADGAPIRVWVPGCATGEEVYSLAIALLEHVEQAGKACPLQIFASDVSERTIERARAGFYPESVLRDVGEERRRRYFTRVEGGYRVNKPVRDACVFVRHDLARDPPFSKLDLVSCRNVLIYFGAALQKKVMATFHYALGEPGFLLLGRSESITGFTRLFTPVDRANKIYARTAVPSRLHLDGNAQPLRWPTAASPAPEAGRAPRDFTAHADRVLLARYGPPGVVVNDRLDILQFRGRTGPYLEPAPGQPQNNLLKMARVGLVPALRAALAAAKKGPTTVRKEGLRFDDNGAMRTCNVVVVPLAEQPGSKQQLFLVLFEPFVPAAGGKVRASRASRPARAEERLRAREVTEELAAARASLHAAMEEHGRARDELTSSNEELVSANEELQSLNEEHEAAKEELQSANEELTTLNDELQARNQELSRLNADLQNLLESVHIPILIVDGERRIRRFTAEARSVLNVLPSDVGRAIGEIRTNLAGIDLDAIIARVITTTKADGREVRGRGERWQRLEVRPYMSAEGATDGAVVSLLDIDELKRAVDTAEWTRDFATSIVESVQVPLAVLGEDLRVISLNEAFRQVFEVADAPGGRFFEMAGGAWDLPPLRKALERMLARDERVDELEVEPELPGVGRRIVSVSARPIDALAGPPIILLELEDVTERARGEADRAAQLQKAQATRDDAQRANMAKDQFLATLSHELRTPLTSLLTQAQLLRRGPLTPEKTARAAEVIERSARTQMQLIEDLLDVSRIIAGKLRLDRRPVNLSDAVRAALELVAAQAERKSVQIDVKLDDALKPIDGDAVRLQQVAWNLLANAIKFTPGGGKIGVAVEQVDDSARLRVSDTGTGIAPEFLPDVFDRFAQSDSSITRIHGGLGLGLAIVRHITELHGGSVRAESAGRGQGATFTVTLPTMSARATAPSASGVPAVTPASSPSAVARLDGVRILLVEDDPDARDSFAEVLGGAGAELVAVGSAEQGRAALRRSRPDVLLSDIAMPGEDGYSFLRSVRALPPAEGGTIPAIAVTAVATAADREQARAAGFQLFLEKPVDIYLLADSVRELSRPRRDRDETPGA